MLTRTTIFAAALLVAACSGGEEAGNNSSGGSESGAAVEQTPANLQDDPTNSVVPLTTPTSGPAAAPAPAASPMAALPTGYQGRWGMTANDCDPARADNKGLLTIAGNRLSFYESRGTATGIRQAGAAQVAFDLPMSGEGQTWSEPTTLTLLDDGKTLIREAKGSPDRAGTSRYSRCPA